MKTKLVSESINEALGGSGKILRPVSGDEIREKFKKELTNIYPDFNEEAQKLLDVICNNNFYAKVMDDLGLNVDYGDDEGPEGPDEFEEEEMNREIGRPQPEPQQKNSQKISAIITGFSQLISKLNLWERPVKEIQDGINGFIKGSKLLSKYKGWDPNTRLVPRWGI